MAKLIINEEEFDLPDDTPIQETCEDAGIPFACTEGICGTCVVEIESGMENLSEFNEAEQDFLGDFDNERLACQCRLKSGTVKIKY